MYGILASAWFVAITFALWDEHANICIHFSDLKRFVFCVRLIQILLNLRDIYSIRSIFNSKLKVYHFESATPCGAALFCYRCSCVHWPRWSLLIYINMFVPVWIALRCFISKTQHKELNLFGGFSSILHLFLLTDLCTFPINVYNRGMAF